MKTVEEMQADRARAEHDEANAFAMELLMPEPFVREAVTKMGGIAIDDEAAVEKLARKFRVSVPVMSLRLGQLYLGASR